MTAKTRRPAGHVEVTEDELEDFAFENLVPIHMPPGSGWATARYGSQKRAAWLVMS